MLKYLKRLLLCAALFMPWVTQAQCDNGVSCNITIEMYDEYGDGWYDDYDDPFYIYVYQNNTLLSQVTLVNGSYGTQTVNVCAGDSVRFVFSGDDYYGEGSFVILDGGNGVIASGDCYDYWTGSQIAAVANACPTCFTPAGVTVNASDADNIVVSWNGATGANSYDVVVLPAGTTFNEATADINSVSDTVTVIDSLTSGSYNIYVRSNCGGGDFSNWAGPANFVIGGCSITIVGTDSYGDGWNDGYLDVMQGGTYLGSFTLTNGSTGTASINVAADTPVSFVWNSGDYDSEVSFEIYNYNNVLLYSTTDPMYGTVFTLANPCSDCFAPTGVHTDSITSDYARLVWNGNADSYGIIWGESVDVAAGNGTATSETTNTFEMTSLTAGTGYTVRLWTLCDDNEASDTVTFLFATIGEAISEFPYTTGFETGDDIAWSFENDATNKWTVGAGAAHTGSNGLYISNDNGTTNAYTLSVTQFSYAYRPLTITSDGQFAVSFDWRTYGESNYDYLRAWIAPGTATLTSGQTPDGTTSSYGYTTTTPAGWIDLGGKMNLQDSWQTTTATPTLTAGNYFLVFMWANDYSSGSQPPAAVDNIMISELTCPTPMAFGIDTIETFQATLDWTPVGSESEWVVRAVSQTYTDAWQSVNTHPYTYTGLNSGTDYTFQLKAVCGGDDSSFVVSCSGSTAISCPAPTNFTVTVSGDTADFAWTDSIGTAWELAYGSVGFSPDTAVTIEYPTSTSFQMTGLDTGIFEAYIRTNCVDDDHSTWVGPLTVNTMPSYIMAATGVDTLHTCNITIYDEGGMDGSYSSNSQSYLYVYPSDDDHVLQISGYSYTESSYDYLRITDLMTGQVMFMDNSTPNGQNITPFTAFGGVEIYFHSDNSITYSGYEINVSCVDAPDCMPIGNVEVVGVTAGSAFLQWSAGAANSYNGAVVEYRDTVSGGNWTVVTTSDNNIVLGGLSDNTYYEVRVAAQCDDNSQASYEYAHFTTAALGCVYDQTSLIDVTVGNGSSTNSYLPSYSLYNYSYTQQFYRASELGGSAVITSITLTPSAITNQRTYEIYMGQSADSTAGSFINPDGLTCVYNGGHIPLAANQPVTFNLTTPFNYSDTSNLVVIFHDITGSWSSGNTWLGDNAWDGASRYVYTDNAAYQVPQSSGGNTSSFRNKITFFGGTCIGDATCSDPYAMVTAVDSTNATLTWIPGASETSWSIDYRLAGTTSWTSVATGVTSTSYTLTNLTPYTQYEARVVSECTEGLFQSTVSFMTDSIIPTCLPVFNLHATGNTSSSITLDWDDPTGAMSWVVSYDTVQMLNPMTGNAVDVTAHPYTVTGLTTGSDYYFYVLNDCGSGDSSTWKKIGPIRPGTWEMRAGETDTLYMCGGTIYDDGGVNGSYSSNQDSYIILYPDTADSYVIVSGTSYTEGTYDYLTIYDGAGTSGTQLWTDYGVTSNQSFGPISSISGALTIAFHSDGSVTYSGFEINVSCAEIPSCLPVSNLHVTSNTSSSITLDWGSYSGNDNSWVVSYSTSQLADPMNGTETAVTAHPYTVTGLVSGSDYYFYVLNDCGMGDSSTWEMVGPVRPGTWEMRANQTDTLYMCGGTIYDDGGATGQYSSNQNSVIILHPDAPNSLVSVSGTSYTEGSFDYLTIYDGVGTSGTQLWSDYGVSSNQTFGPIESLNGPLTIAFHSDGSLTYAGFEINVSCVSTACRVMNLIQDASVTASGTQLAITWDAVTDALQYEIEYGNVGFEHGQGQTMTTTTNNAVITGLTAMTNYDIYVRSICSGNEPGNWAHVSLQTAMCDNPVEVYNYDTTQASGTSSHFPIGYSYWNYSYVQTIIPASRLADLTGEITAFAFNASTVSAGSSEFDGMTMWMANVSEDNLENGFIMPNTTDHVFYKVIDNADFSFSETGWQIHSLDTAFSWDGVSNVLIAVNRENGHYASSPNFAAHDDTVARACYVYNDNTPYDYTSVSDGNPSTTVGDILLISCGVGCPRPNGLYATDVNYASANLHWVGSAANYEVAVKAATEGTWPSPVAVNNATSYSVSGLTPSTQYQFRVRAICDAAAGLISDWSVGNFTTDELPCLVPTELHVTETHTTSVTFAWNAVSAQNQWSIHVWNTAGAFDFEANSNPYTATGLASNTTYYAAIKAVCGGGAAESEYGDTISFTTGACPQVTGLGVSNVSSHSVVLSWNAAEGANSYVIEYGDLNFSQGNGTTVEVADGSTTYTLTGLDDDEDYSVYVMAVCEGANGDWSEQLNFHTSEGNGINELTIANSQLSIYPNPTSDATTIDVKGVNGEVQIAIVDMNGRTVHGETMGCDGDCSRRIEVGGLAQGTYFVHVSGEGVNMVRKLIVK